MKSAEFLKKIVAAGAAAKIPVRVESHRGSGDHRTLYCGDRFTILKAPDDEIGPGLLQRMMADLGLVRRERR
ncbi:MAG: type II toxin-antitoxin system HicA family toxin [Proteobacteria bacterium]|nr:type II toxin-antitoxin system HicA family toxin [Pseudomonadota bacterium]